MQHQPFIYASMCWRMQNRIGTGRESVGSIQACQIAPGGGRLEYRSAHAARVATKIRQLLHDIQWHAIILAIAIVGHVGMLGNGNRDIMGALGLEPSKLTDCLHQVAILTWKYFLHHAQGVLMQQACGCGAISCCSRASQCQPALQASSGITQSLGAAVPEDHSQRTIQNEAAGCVAARKCCNVEVSMQLRPSHQLLHPHAFQPPVEGHADLNSYLPGLRRRACLAA